MNHNKLSKKCRYNKPQAADNNPTPRHNGSHIEALPDRCATLADGGDVPAGLPLAGGGAAQQAGGGDLFQQGAGAHARRRVAQRAGEGANRAVH